MSVLLKEQLGVVGATGRVVEFVELGAPTAAQPGVTLGGELSLVSAWRSVGSQFLWLKSSSSPTSRF